MRNTQPSNTNKYYLKTTAGGYNKCILGNIQPCKGSVLSNCVGYAYGRFMEYNNLTECKLTTGNASTFFQYKYDGYARGTVPKVGAIICWSGGRTGAGHVAFVEKINIDGSLLCSESGWSGPIFQMRVVPDTYYLGSLYKFQGFIYSPTKTTSTEIGGDDMTKGYFYEGEKNEGVYAYKQLLRLLKTKGKIKTEIDNNNIFGAGTKKATLEVQKLAKIAQDGYAGPQTIQACFNLLK